MCCVSAQGVDECAINVHCYYINVHCYYINVHCYYITVLVDWA